MASHGIADALLDPFLPKLRSRDPWDAEAV